MGRQLKIDGVLPAGNYDDRISVRFTVEERAELIRAASARAQRTGLQRVSLAAFIRDAALYAARTPGLGKVVSR